MGYSLESINCLLVGSNWDQIPGAWTPTSVLSPHVPLDLRTLPWVFTSFPQPGRACSVLEVSVDRVTEANCLVFLPTDSAVCAPLPADMAAL